MPRGEQVALETWLDDPAIYDEDATEVPPLPTAPVLATPTVPSQVSGLSARIVGNEIPRRLEASWNPASGAASYISAVSYDAGASWTPLPEVREPRFDVTIFPQDLRLRVAGANTAGRPGLYTQIEVIAPPLSADNVPIGLGNLVPGLREKVTTQADDAAAATRTVIERLAEAQAERDAQSYLDRQDWRFQMVATADRVTASYNEAITVATGPGSGIVQSITTLEASVDALGGDLASLDASVDTRITAAVGPDSAIADAITALESQLGDLGANLDVSFTTVATLPAGALAAYQLVAKVSDELSTSRAAMLVAAYSDGAGGARSVVQFDAESFSVVNSASGETISPFVISDTSAAISGVFIKDGTVTAEKFDVAELGAITGNLGSIYTAYIQLGDPAGPGIVMSGRPGEDVFIDFFSRGRHEPYHAPGRSGRPRAASHREGRTGRRGPRPGFPLCDLRQCVEQQSAAAEQRRGACRVAVDTRDDL
ncbi:DUF1983 domain-containing protein [Ancylobacter dichloromethanicus]